MAVSKSNGGPAGDARKTVSVLTSCIADNGQTDALNVAECCMHQSEIDHALTASEHIHKRIPVSSDSRNSQSWQFTTLNGTHAGSKTKMPGELPMLESH